MVDRSDGKVSVLFLRLPGVQLSSRIRAYGPEAVLSVEYLTLDEPVAVVVDADPDAPAGPAYTLDEVVRATEKLLTGLENMLHRRLPDAMLKVAQDEKRGVELINNPKGEMTL